MKNMFAFAMNLVHVFTRRLPRNSWIYAIFDFKGLHPYERYLEVEKIAKKTGVHSNILDVGAGGPSSLKELHSGVLSLDVGRSKGLDLVGSVTSLPFRSSMFDCVTAVDMLEHLEKNERKKALDEMKRVGNIVIIHLPLDDGQKFMAKRGDLALDKFICKRRGYHEACTLEHLNNRYSTLEEIQSEGFLIVKPDWNLEIWCTTAELSYALPAILTPFVIALYVIFLRKKLSPPWWGAYFIYEANASNKSTTKKTK